VKKELVDQRVTMENATLRAAHDDKRDQNFIQEDLSQPRLRSWSCVRMAMMRAKHNEVNIILIQKQGKTRSGKQTCRVEKEGVIVCYVTVTFLILITAFKVLN